MFQTAHFIALSKTYGVKLSSIFLAPYCHYFSETEIDFFVRFPSKKTFFRNKKLKVGFYQLCSKLFSLISKIGFKTKYLEVIDLGWEKQLNIESDFFLKQASSKKLVVVMGWHFQHQINLYQFHEKICTYFTPKSFIVDKINSAITIQRKDSNLLVGVHIRRGDYTTFENGKYYYNDEVYVKTMSRIVSLFPNKKVKFIITSNECINANSFALFDFFILNGNAIEDLYSLAECDFVTGPPSTFSMWAAFYKLKPLYMIKDPEFEFTLSDFQLPVLNTQVNA